jgi:mono/diheme cytochrome c family protein
MKERNAARVSKLIDLIAAQPAGAARQVALLNGMAGKAPSKKSKYIARPLKLASAPAGVATLQASKVGMVKSAFARVDPQIVWSGKPGWVEPVIVPLNSQQQSLYEQGKTVYSSICVACHQPNGAGMAGLAPPLVDSEWVLGQPDKIIRIITQGLSGPIEVKGSKWELEMPGLPIFTDEQIAGIVTYIRREWEHTGDPVAPDFVTKVRAAIKGHVKPWSADELKKSVDVKTVSAK